MSMTQEITQAGLPEGAIARLGKGGINIMRFTPDGTRLVVGTDVGLWIYEIESGKGIQLYTEKLGQVNVLSFSSDGKTFASGGFANPIIQLWELETGNKLSNLDLRKIDEDIISITGLSFFANDSGIIILYNNGKIVNWSVDTNIVEIIPYDNKIHNAVLVSEKPGIIAVEDQARNIHFFEPISGIPYIGQNGHDVTRDKRTKNIRVFAFSPNDKFLATGSIGNEVILWDFTKQEVSSILKGNSAKFAAIAFSNDNKILAGGDAHGTIKLWELDNCTEIMELIGHKNGICDLLFSPDGKTLVSGGSDGTIRFWDYQTGKEISTFATGHIKWIKEIAFTIDDTILKCVDFNGYLYAWSLKTHELLSTKSFGQSGVRGSVVFAEDAELLALQENRWDFAFDPWGPASNGRLVGGLGAPKNNIKIKDLSKDETIDTSWMEYIGCVDAMLISHDNKTLTVGIDQKGMFSWNINTGEELFHYEYSEPHKIKLTFSPDEKLLATSGWGIKSQVWEFETQQELILPELKVALSVAFSPDGTLMAMAQPKSIILWHITPDGLEEGNSFENVRVREDLLFSPDSKKIVFSTENNFQNYIQLLDVQTGTASGLLPAHTERITTLSFSHDGKLLTSASVDGTVVLWDWDKISSNVNDIAEIDQ